MSKVFSMSILIIGIIFLLKLSGIESDPTGILSYVGLTNGQTNVSQFALAVIAFLATVTGLTLFGGFTAGLFGVKIPYDFVLLSGFATGTLILFSSLTINIINLSNGYSPWIYNSILLIFGIVGFAYIYALAEWVFNR